jgi:TRAP-type C4-dicarboxylate transport system permease large subunit
MTGGGMMGAFLALMVTGLPVAMAMAGAALIYVMLSGNIPDFVVIHRMYGGVDSFPLLAVPFFIWAGNLMNSAGITNRIYNFALALVGWMKGGLGHVNVVGSMIFAGMSGTAIADAAGLGTIEIKAMTDHGYSKEFAVGVTAASATVGPIIPPSLPFVIYGMMAGVSIGQLFLAGVIPGIIMGATMMLTVAYFAHTRNFGRDVPFSAWKLVKAGLEIAMVGSLPVAIWLIWKLGISGGWATIIVFGLLLALDKIFNFSAVMALLTPVLLIGGMTMGVFTPTEGAIAASMWALFLGLFWYRTLDWRRLIKITMDTIETFGWLLTVTRVTDAVAEWVLAFSSNPHVFLLLANLLLLFVGCFLEPTAAITLLVPILVPICAKLGIDLVHFGLVMVLNLMIGLLHPPMGTVLFVLSRVAKLSFERTTIAILPWLLPLLLTLGLCTYVPEVVLWLPRQFF